MFQQVAEDLQIALDYKSKDIKVRTGNIFAPGFEPIWGEVESFASAKDWYSSPYAVRITDEDMQLAIDWFWIDMMEESVKTPPQ